MQLNSTIKNCTLLVKIFIVLTMHEHTAFAMSLQFIQDVNIPTQTVIDETPFGGISGLAFDHNRQSLIGISDDRSTFAPARGYSFAWKNAQDQMELKPTSKLILTRSDGSEFPKGAFDGEGLAIHQNGTYFISSEGDVKASPRIPPSLFLGNDRGKISGELTLPAKFIPEAFGAQTKGIVNNGAFEGLALSPNARFLFALLESPLIQDDSSADFEKGSLNRGVIYQINDHGEVALYKEFVYPVGQVSRRGTNEASGGNGVSEILAVADDKLLVLERGGVISEEGVWTTQALLYLVDLSAASDVQTFDSLRQRSFISATKTLVLNFDSLLPRLTPGFQSIDNLEAMVLPPASKDGSQDLIIASDNNFSESQRSQFLFFKVNP